MSADHRNDDATGRSALAKASWRLLPLLGLAYLIAYIDRSNISFAAAQMNADLGFSATVYGLGAGMFFLSYALFEVPSNMLMMRFGPRWWLARIMITWGLLSAAMMFVRTPASFYGLRFLIGLAEAGFFPAVVYYLTHWFPQAQRGRALSGFYLFGPLGVVVLGLVSGWLLGLDGVAGLRGWHWLFLVQGLPAALLGVVLLFVLADTPATARWLSPAERDWLVEAMARDAGRVAEPASHDVRTALRNPLVWYFGTYGALTIGTFYAFTFSTPVILGEKTGWDVTHVGYLTSMGGVIGALAMAGGGWFADRRGERFITLYAGMAIEIVGLTIVAGSSGPAAIAGFLLFAFGWPLVTLASVMLWSDMFHVRTLAISCAAVNTINMIGAFVSPYLFGYARDATGGYTAGMAALPVCLLAATAIVAFIQLRAAPRVPAAAI